MTQVEMAARVLTVLLARPESHTDVDRSLESREARLAPVAHAVSAASRTLDEAAVLMALGEHETNYAEHVLAGHCDQMPEGERCDGGRARGPWQLHKEACPVAWALPDGSQEALDAEAGCAIRLLRWNAVRGREHTITPGHAAFAGYAARDWGWPGAEKRVKTSREIYRALYTLSHPATAAR